jgi:hypothetical protein
MSNFEKLNLWLKISSELNMLDHLESDAHPHCPEEKADLYHCAPFGPTEFEVLNFLFATVLLYKPKNILDTGTQSGYSSLAMAAAINFNGLGHVTTIDRGEVIEARTLAERNGLNNHITYVMSDSVEFIEKYEGEPFDLAFFDTSIHIRHIEVMNLWNRNKLNKLVAFHDTSRLRYITMNEGTGDDFSPEYIASLDEFASKFCLNGIENHNARGFRIMEIKK